MEQDVRPHRVSDQPMRPPRRKRAWLSRERHRWLDEWLVANEEPLKRLVRWVVQAVEKIEQNEGVRQRARRSDDQAKHRVRVDVITSNLARAVLSPPPTGRLAVRLGNLSAGMTRYDNRALGSKPLRNLINLLAASDFLTRHEPKAQRGEVTSLSPSAGFASKVRQHGVSLTNFGRHRDEELIILSRARRLSRFDAEKYREPVDYDDTAQTRAWRKELRRLNDFLAAAEVAFVEDGLEPAVDPFERTLTRRFTILPDQEKRFDQNGRLVGGFWQNLKKERRGNIRIRGEPVAALDFNATFTRLAYARLGLPAPDGDPYAVAGAEGYRTGIKRAMNILLFDNSLRRRSWPKEIGIGVGSDADAERGGSVATFEGRLPAGWTVSRTKKAILARHPALKQAWGKGLGLGLMYDESRVLLAALKALMAVGVPALPIHDALLVQASKRDAAKRAMEEAARGVVGADIPVSVKE